MTPQVWGARRTLRAAIRELRCVPPGGERFISWESLPSVVAEASAWIRRQAAELAGHTLLLAAVMPPEAALGLGVAAGQVSEQGWPARLWPIVYRPGDSALVIPNLNLGSSREPSGQLQ
jgi:hypothetical protein